MREKTQGITERKAIIDKYCQYCILDREDAISKIMSLRSTDNKVLEVACATTIVNAIPLENATNDNIINELQMQISILNGELIDGMLQKG